MKKRVYKIKDKILVRGNENELTKDEILVKEENDSVVLKERVNGEVKDIVVKGGEPEYITIQNLPSTSANVGQCSVNEISITEEQKNILVLNNHITFILKFSYGSTNVNMEYFFDKISETQFIGKFRILSSESPEDFYQASIALIMEDIIKIYAIA